MMQSNLFNQFLSKRNLTFFFVIWVPSIIWLGYSNSLNAVFHFDDIPFLVERNWESWTYYFKEAFSSLGGRNFALILFSLNHQWDGLNPYGYHIVNIAIHIINAWVLCLLVYTLLKSTYVQHQERQYSLLLTAMSVATIFAIHPLASAAVTYLTQRTSQMATLFYMLATLCYVKARDSFFDKNYKPSVIWVSLALASYWVAAGSKSMAMTWLVVPVLYEALMHLDSWQKIKRALLPVILGTLGIAGVLFYFLKDNALFKDGNYFVGFGSDTLWSATEHWQTMSRVMVFYWKLITLPVLNWMNVDHNFDPAVGQDLTLYAVAFHVAVIAMLLFLAHKKFRLCAFGGFWFYLTFGPYIIVPERDILVEYKAYLPMIGWMLFLADVIFWAIKNQKSKIIGCGLVAFVLFGIWGTRQRNAVYETTETLWKDAAHKAPTKARTLHNLGFAYGEQKQFRAAKVYFNKSLQSASRFLLARINLARVYRSMGNYDQSLKEYQIITKIAPHVSMWEVQGIINDAFLEQAQLHGTRGEYSKIIELLQRRPAVANQNQGRLTLATAHKALGQQELQAGNYEKAFQHLRQSVSINPNDPEVFNNLGVILANAGQAEEAKTAFNAALQIDPQYTQAKDNLKLLQQLQEKE